MGQEHTGVAEQVFQQGPALTQGAVFEVFTVQVEEVERVVNECAARRQPRAVLQHLEGGLALLVDRDGLAVEDEGGGFYLGNVGGDFGEFAGEIVAASGVEPDFVAVFNGLESVAVEFEFVFPVGALRERPNELGQHRRGEGERVGHG